MILTCPDCSTSYNVDAAKIPPEGRTVKCASCGHRWTAMAEAPELIVDEASSEPELAPLAVESAVEESAAEDLPKEFRAKAADDRKVREAATTGIVWAAMAAALVVMVAVAGVFRINVVNLWPKTAAAYAWVGLPVNSLGLTIEGVRAEPALQDGHAALSVSGMFRNVKDRAVTAPPLRISLINKAGRTVATKIAQPADAVVPPGETRHFAIAILDPPVTASQLEVAFAPEAAHKNYPKAARHVVSRPVAHGALREATPPVAPAAVAVEHPPVAVEAKPLPANSPYALEPHG
jgi:predicted Zn finger-like uncharacterized protein